MDALRSNIYFLKQSNLIAHKHRHDGFYVFYISISYSLVDFAHKMAEPRINCYKDIFGIKMISILCTLTYPKSFESPLGENVLLIIY